MVLIQSTSLFGLEVKIKHQVKKKVFHVSVDEHERWIFYIQTANFIIVAFFVEMIKDVILNLTRNLYLAPSPDNIYHKKLLCLMSAFILITF